MKVITILLFILFVVIIQGKFSDAFSIKGIKPDLPLILSYGIGLYKGEMKGLILGGFIGFLMDSSTGILLGPNLTSKATVGFSSGYLRKKIFRVTATVNLIAIFILSIIDGIMNFLFINIFLSDSSFIDAFHTLILPQALYCSVLGVPIMILTERILKSKVDLDVREG